MLQVATRLDRSYIDKGQKKEEKRESTHHLKSDSLHQFWNKSKRISLLRSSRRPCHASTAVVVGEASISDDVRGGGMGQGERALPSSPVSLFRREEGRSDGNCIVPGRHQTAKRKASLPSCLPDKQGGENYPTKVFAVFPRHWRLAQVSRCFLG